MILQPDEPTYQERHELELFTDSEITAQQIADKIANRGRAEAIVDLGMLEQRLKFVRNELALANKSYQETHARLLEAVTDVDCASVAQHKSGDMDRLRNRCASIRGQLQSIDDRRTEYLTHESGLLEEIEQYTSTLRMAAE